MYIVEKNHHMMLTIFFFKLSTKNRSLPPLFSTLRHLLYLRVFCVQAANPLCIALTCLW